MFRKRFGDVKVGFVESALTSEFVVVGDRTATLAELKESARSYNSHSVRADLPEGYVHFNTIHGVGVIAARHVRPLSHTEQIDF